MNKICVRIFHCQRGESIGEVLVALLISSFGLVLLASMISSASKMVTNSKSKVEQYIKEENVIVKQDESKNHGDGTVTIKINGNSVQLTDSSPTTYPVYIFTNSELRTPVVTFKHK